MSITYHESLSGAPTAIGPYSIATECGSLVFISGQVPIDPSTGKLVDGGIEAQATQVMKNLTAALAALGLNFSHVCKSTILLTDMSDFSSVNEIYAEHLAGAKPARATFAVKALPAGASIEIEMIANKA
jgi:2-iminobutanoate/2-iminopropanoate deaminase